MSQTNGTIRIGAYSVDLNQVLGKGATGYVYRGYHTETFEPVAVKAIQMAQINNEVTKYLLEGEKKAMLTIKSPFVIKTHDIVQQKDYCYIVMELCSNGTLKDFIQAKGCLPPDQSIDIFKKLVIGYIAIVDSLFIHRDLKTANILLKANGDPAIIDFGYCQMIMGKRPMIQYNVGSPSYMSPQAHSKSRYSQKSDIWSLGVILHEMLTGKTIDNGFNIKEFFKIIEAQGRVRLNFDGMTDVCKDILVSALQVDPEQRATIHKLKYVIDKSLIPQMQAKLQKAHSSGSQKTNNSNSSSDLKYCPAFLNYPKSTTSAAQKKQKINEQLRFLRGSDHFQREQDKAPAGIQVNPTNQRNQHSLMQMQKPIQNIPPMVPHQHPILRKSLDRGQKIMKKIVSVREVVDQSHNLSHSNNHNPILTLKKIPVLTKAISLENTPVQGQNYRSVPNREGIVSMRII